MRKTLPLEKKKVITILKYVLGLGLGIFLLYLAMKGVDLEEVKNGFQEANYLWVALGLVLAILSHWFRAVRWKMLFKAAGYESNSFNLFAGIMVGYMVNQAVPRAGEITRVTLGSQTEKIPLSVSFGTWATDRIFDVIMLGLLVLIAFAIQFEQIQLILDKAFAATDGAQVADGSGSILKWVILGGMVLGGLAFLILRKKIFATKIGGKLYKFLMDMWNAILSIRKMQNPLLFVFYTLGIWACYVLMTFLVFYALDGSSGLPFGFALTVFVMGGIGMVIPSPGGIGTYHFAVIMSFVAYASQFGWAEEEARILGTNIAFIIHTSQLIMMILVGFLCYLYLVPKLRAKGELQTVASSENEPS